MSERTCAGGWMRRDTKCGRESDRYLIHFHIGERKREKNREKRKREMKERKTWPLPLRVDLSREMGKLSFLSLLFFLSRSSSISLVLFLSHSLTLSILLTLSLTLFLWKDKDEFTRVRDSGVRRKERPTLFLSLSLSFRTLFEWIYRTTQKFGERETERAKERERERIF